MSSILDKSLDEILSDKPKTLKKRAPAAKSKVAKAPAKKAVTKNKTPAKAVAPVLDVSYADKVVVYNLPTDIKYDAVKDFFASQVGGVKKVDLQYNEKGQSRGIATVIFKSATSASKAVEKYNGAPIDGGKQKLKLELVIDPSKKPLVSRIVANSGSKTPKGPKKEQPKKANPKADNKKPQQKKKENKPKRAPKKTVEQLDQEMADYFEKK